MKSKKVLLAVFWTIILLLSAWFYFDNAVAYLFGYRNPRFGESLFTNQVWFVAHVLGATCSMFLGPVQFWKSFRIKYIKLHRLLGKIYIIGSLVAAVTAFRLALLFDCVGCRYSLIPLSVFFAFTTLLGWYAIRQKNIVAHQQFMIRSYTCSLAFVFVRLYQVIPLGFMFDPIDNPDIQGVVMEWFFSFMPILLVEVVMIWLPSLKVRENIRTIN